MAKQPNQLQKSEFVIPADKVLGKEAGIQSFQQVLDPRFHGGDTIFYILQSPQS
jgi:hypothetical protein